jgi:hypothetical protein
MPRNRILIEKDSKNDPIAPALHLLWSYRAEFDRFFLRSVGSCRLKYKTPIIRAKAIPKILKIREIRKKIEEIQQK